MNTNVLYYGFKIVLKIDLVYRIMHRCKILLNIFHVCLNEFFFHCSPPHLFIRGSKASTVFK